MIYNEKQTYAELFRQGCEELRAAGVGEADTDARLLLEWCLGTDRNTLLAHGDRGVSREEYDRYADAVGRRRARVPLQYITGEQDFMGLTFVVNEKVLIPRQDTEVLAEEVLRHLHDGMRILDMCTGSGCILFSLLRYSNGCTGVGVDVSEEALSVARANAERILGAQALDSMRVTLRQGDLFTGMDESDRFDIIVSNPPYIKTSVIESLMPEVREHEPRTALDGHEDGLFFYRQIIGQAGRFLQGGGMLFLEIGYDQGESVRLLMEEAGYREIEVIRDYAGLDRVVCGGKYV